MTFPSLYNQIYFGDLNWTYFIYVTTKVFLEGLFLSLFVYGCFGLLIDQGSDFGHFNEGIMMLMAVVFISNFTILNKANGISFLLILSIIVSNGVFILLWLIFTSIES